MNIIEEVTKGIKDHGACKLFKGGSLETLIQELFTPQGVEFIMKTSYPGLDEFRKIQKMRDLKPYGIYVDSGIIELSEQRKVFLIGNTDAKLNYQELVDSKVYIIHGAKAYISASGYSVVKVEKDHNSMVNIRAKNKAVILK